jgi:subtilisin family serine protease
MIVGGVKMVKSAPKTLFVFAAGNDGSDNDRYPTSPTNIRAENVISVAATYEVQFLAPFSNYGATLVDVAAPGMLINSTIPGNVYLKVSGTSQASPYVANIAAQIKTANPALTPGEVKQILMGTVDSKSFLVGKVASGGIVNTDRAVMAGDLSRQVGVNEAISRARQSVRDVLPSRPALSGVRSNVHPLPLQPMFR